MSEDLHTLTGAYVLHALSDEEAERFREHLEACPDCRHEVRELQETATRLSDGQQEQPPAGLKERVMTAVGEEAQQPPLRGSDQPSGVASRRWLPRVGAAAAAAVLAVALGVGVAQWLEPDEGSAEKVAQVFEAPDATTTVVSTKKGADIVVAVSQSLDRMALDSDELPSLGEQQVYQLWTLQDGKAESAGLLESPEHGAAIPAPGSGVKVAITVEPEGGSQQPTSKPIIVITPSKV